MIELTVPAEEGFEAAEARKLARYKSLTESIIDAKWKPTLMTVEVGARGCPAFSVRRCCRNLGMSGRLASSLCKSVSQIAARCSHTIYLARSNKTWDATRELLTEPSQKSAELPSGPTAPAVDQDMDTAPRITELEDSATLLCPAPPKRMCYLATIPTVIGFA